MPKFLQSIILGRIAQGIAAGKYGKLAASAYAALKGRKTILGGVLFLVGAALVAFAHPLAPTLGPALAACGAVLTSLGLIDKGTDKMPPLFDAGLGEAFAFVCSLVTIVGKAANGLVLLAHMSGKPWAQDISASVQLFALACTTATGYLATYFVEPAPPAVADPSRFGGGRAND